MRGLAEFVLKGRRQAIMAVLLIGAVPLIYFLSPVVVALVILRKGVQEAGLLLAWALLPIGAWALYPSIALDAPVNLLPVLVLLAVSALAMVLRSTGSWQSTVLVAVVVGLLFELYLRLQPDNVELLLLQINPLLQESGATQTISSGELIALVSIVHAGMSLLLLMWSRWMQAMLFNPGGFKTEFHSLRIERKAALPLLLLIVLSGMGVIIPDSWMLYFVMPPLFAGTALVHATVALKQLSPFWLFMFYMVFPVIVQFLVIFALMDSWFDFRKRMRTST
ncbi:MAG: hypothetical protein JKY98_02900 [Gammaproteobacteria bacterium]|nr:hypothetical protein [Gammaproteobacteria bacterium]